MTREDAATSHLSTVLVATDFSPTSLVALQRGSELALRHGARVLLVHTEVLHPVPVGGPRGVMLSVGIDQQVREMSRTRLEELADSTRSQGLEVETVVTSGSPSVGIVEQADEAGADLIVIGTRGLSGFRHLLLGSTAEHVVRHANCPVLTIHPGDVDSLLEPLVVIVPTLLSTDPTPAVDRVVQLLGRSEQPVRLLLVHADHLPMYLQPFLKDISIDRIGFEEIEAQLQERLAPIAKRLADSGFLVESIIEEGDVASVITDAAELRSANLIVMETHRRSGLAHLLMGSATERVVQHACCPVLAIHPNEGAEAAEAAKKAAS
jgi:nucleotide-binding universal stress UspA family protein